MESIAPSISGYTGQLGTATPTYPVFLPHSQARLIEGLLKSPTNTATSAPGLVLPGEDMVGTPPVMQSLLGEMARDGGGGQPFADYQQQQQQQIFGGNQQVSWRPFILASGATSLRIYTCSIMPSAAFTTAGGCNAVPC